MWGVHSSCLEDWTQRPFWNTSQQRKRLRPLAMKWGAQSICYCLIFNIYHKRWERLWGRLQVQFWVRISVQFRVRFAAKGVSMLIWFDFVEMCKLAIVMGVRWIFGSLFGLNANRARNRTEIHTQIRTFVDSPFVLGAVYTSNYTNELPHKCVYGLLHNMFCNFILNRANPGNLTSTVHM
jgi:hypothetical protein